MPQTLDIITLVATLVVKPVIVMALVLLFVLRPSERSAAQNHWLLVTTLALLGIALLGAPLIPELSLIVLPQSLAHLEQLPLNHLFASQSALLFFYLFVSVYVLGFTWRVSYLVLSLWAAQKLKESAIPLSDYGRKDISQTKASLDTHFGFASHRVNLLMTEQLASPMMMGWRNAAIVLPAQALAWPAARLQRVLAHEYAHVERADWCWKWLSSALTALLWFLPLTWLLSRWVNWFAEVACDNRVATWLDCRADYADDLLAIASDVTHHAFALSWNDNKQLYRRIQVLLDPTENRSVALAPWRMAVLILLTLLIAPLAMARFLPVANGYYPDPLAVYPQPVAVPQVLVPEASPLANSQRRIAWLDRQLRLQRPPAPENKQEMAETGAESPNLKMTEPQRDARSIWEESMVVELPAPTKPLPEAQPLNSHSGAPALPAPGIAMSGYVPQRMVIPNYPRRAVLRSLEGRVVVQFDVDERGEVINPTIISASPRGYFEREVLNAISEFKFLPLQLNGEKIITKNVTETFVFTLE